MRPADDPASSRVSLGIAFGQLRGEAATERLFLPPGVS